MSEKIIRIVSRSSDGSLKTRDHDTLDVVKMQFEQYGVDDCSTDLSLRGYPLFRGLIGPISEGKKIARYETPDVYESLTKEWASQKVRRKPKAVHPVVPAVHFNLGITFTAGEYV